MAAKRVGFGVIIVMVRLGVSRRWRCDNAPWVE